MLLPKSEEELLKALGNNIRKLRQEKNLSMEQLANLADIELSQVYRIENGKINCKVITLIAIATALETSVDSFFL